MTTHVLSELECRNTAVGVTERVACWRALRIRLYATIPRCVVPGDLRNFSILNSTSNPLDSRILESLYIFKLKPTLNNDMSSCPLRVHCKKWRCFYGVLTVFLRYFDRISTVLTRTLPKIDMYRINTEKWPYFYSFFVFMWDSRKYITIFP